MIGLFLKTIVFFSAGIVKKIIPQREVLITSGKVENVTLNVDIFFQKPFKGAPLEGHNMWEVSLWLSRLKNGKDEQPGVRNGQVLSNEHRSQTIRNRANSLSFEVS